MRDKLVTHALLAGYSTLLMHGRYPAAAVFLEVPSAEVDVNVHPAKSEVRFRHGGAVHELLARAVQARLRDQRSEAPRTTIGLGGVAPPQIPLRMPPRAEGARPSRRRCAWSTCRAPAPYRAGGAAAGASRPTRRRAGFFAALRPLGQVFEGYLICEGARVSWCSSTSTRRTSASPSSACAAPTPAAGAAPAAAGAGGGRARAARGGAARRAARHARRVGFEVEPYGGGTFAVRAVPALLADTDAAVLVRDVAEELVDVGRSRRLDQAAEAVLSRLACHSAVRVGQNMGPEQMRALLTAMDEVDFAGNCPHGRPAFLVLSRGDLERWFKRT